MVSHKREEDILIINYSHNVILLCNVKIRRGLLPHKTVLAKGKQREIRVNVHTYSSLFKYNAIFLYGINFVSYV